MDTDVYNALIASVIADPENDLPRLVFADFLEESGQPERAEFIRVQIELAANPSAPATVIFSHDKYWAELHRRSVQLFAEFGREWFGDTALWMHEVNSAPSSPHLPGLVVGRGFPYTARGPLGWWCGGECEGCRGMGEVEETDGEQLDAGYHTATCWTCNGSGRTPANGPELVRKWPLTRAAAADLDPLFSRLDVGGPDGDWCWVVRSAVMIGDDVDAATHLLPPDLWEMLTGFDTTPSARVRAKRYPSRKQADDALSQALLSWAKSRPVAV